MIDLKKLADIQPSLTGNEFSVLFYITNSCSYAQSIGLDYYEASYKQIREHTNIKKDDTIKSVLDHLIELGLITKQTEWSDEKNRKTKCKFTSSLVIPTAKNTVETENKVETDSKSTPKNGLETEEKSTPKNGEINKLNIYNQSKLNNTYNISDLYKKCEQTINSEQLMEVEEETEVQRKYNNIKSDIDKGNFSSLGELQFRITIDNIPAREANILQHHYHQWDRENIYDSEEEDNTPMVQEEEAVYYKSKRA